MRTLFAFLIVVFACAARAGAQSFPILPSASSPPAQGVGITKGVLFTTAPITLDGEVLFRIASPTDGSADTVPVDMRQNSIQNVLAQIVGRSSSNASETEYDPSTFKVSVKRYRDQAVLQVSDRTHETPVALMTITTADAEYNQTDPDELAQQWRRELQEAIVESLTQRQPGVVRASFELASRVALILAGVSIAVIVIVALLRRVSARLETQIEEAASAVSTEQAEQTPESAEPRMRRRLFALLLRVTDPQQRLSVYRALSAILLWGLLLGWLIFLTWAFSLFPETTPYAREFVRTAGAVATIWIVAGLANRVLDLLIGRITAAWQPSRSMSPEDRARLRLRIPTTARALGGFKTFIVVFVAVLATLTRIGIPIGSVITFGGLVAIGVSLASQNLIRDLVTGFLVLLEDQYVVGDYITINDRSGIVENLNLRMVQIRDSAGSLATISHSSVTSVINQSRNWSRVDYRISVDGATDTEKAMDVLRSSIETLAKEDAWRDAVIQPIEWIGIDSMSRNGIVLRAAIKTAPLRQFQLQRAINERVRTDFAKNGIAFGAAIKDLT